MALIDQFQMRSLKTVYDGMNDLRVPDCPFYIRFGTKLSRQIVGIPMGTNCAPLVADLLLYCYERDFMDSLNDDKRNFC